MFNDDRDARTRMNVEGLQSALRDAQRDLAELSGQVRLQRKVIEKLVQFVGDTGDAGKALLQEKEVRELLHLQPEQAGSGRVIGKLRCTQCSSVVDDKEGVTNEVCQWCGAQLVSVR
ncbi:hypothetical protein [Hyalangium rubrum]|uniref:Zinc ribbon domain-containing protein n=1 Tax=Hyalangium rubrum TaxID=3103134 RepID=A0ABU5H2V6_9BACT|nr:hypothetical protein [Hyalangium sp. s54d21]MDY7227793.1 hypothetical protein [Hyalangium sp. s54d21]